MKKPLYKLRDTQTSCKRLAVITWPSSWHSHEYNMYILIHAIILCIQNLTAAFPLKMNSHCMCFIRSHEISKLYCHSKFCDLWLLNGLNFVLIWLVQCIFIDFSLLHMYVAYPFVAPLYLFPLKRGGRGVNLVLTIFVYLHPFRQPLYGRTNSSGLMFLWQTCWRMTYGSIMAVSIVARRPPRLVQGPSFTATIAEGRIRQL